MSAVMQICLVARACCDIILAQVSKRFPILSPGLDIISIGLFSKAASMRSATSQVEQLTRT